MLFNRGSIMPTAHAEQAARSSSYGERRLGWYQITIIFLVWSVAGLILEEVFMWFSTGVVQSRAGLVWGPFSPLYGTGAVLITVVLLRLHDVGASKWQIICASMLLGGILEQVTGWTMETLFGLVSWDYIRGGIPGAITKWVAVPYLFMWGGLGFVWDRFVMPGLIHVVGGPTTKKRRLFAGFVVAFLIVDILLTLACFGRMARREANIPPSNIIEEWVDDKYDEEFVASRFQNMMDTEGRPIS